MRSDDHGAPTSAASRWPSETAPRRGRGAAQNTILDRAIFEALVNADFGATWVSTYDGVGIRYAAHVGHVIVADGTREAAIRLERVLTADPATGVIRHADAGYEKAERIAKERGIKIPGR